jgi:hypothetical protein
MTHVDRGAHHIRAETVTGRRVLLTKTLCGRWVPRLMIKAEGLATCPKCKRIRSRRWG